MTLLRFAPRAPSRRHGRACPFPSSLIGLASLASLASLTAGLPSASAQTQLAPIVVTGSREPQPVDRLIADIVVIDAARIRASGADSLEDLLRREAGVQVSRNGGPGQGASVLIRGGNANNTVVLLDGVRIGSATLGQTDMAAIALAQIERIEVLRGPGSSLYGADAVGGVVQIFTRRGEGAPRVDARAALGGLRSSEAGFGVSGAQGGLDYAASLGRESSRGVSALRPGDLFGNHNADADGFRRHTGQAKLGFTPAAGHRIGASWVESRLNAQYDGSEFLPPAFAPDATPDFRNRLTTRIGALDYRGTLTPHWTTSVQLARGLDDLTSGATAPDRFRTRRGQLTWQNAWTLAESQQLVAAYERLNERADSNLFSADLERHNDALVLGYTGNARSVAWQADLRHDRNSAYGGNTTGRLGASAEVVPGLRVRALAGTTYRAPSFNELGYPGYGVPGLAPERGRSVEFGLAWRAGTSEAAATIYQSTLRDMIGYEPDTAACPADPAYSFGCAANIGRARLRGATLSGAHHVGGLRLAATIDLLDAKDRATGERLARRAAHQTSLAADYAAGAWRVGASVLRLGARPEGAVTLAGTTTLDLRARWRFRPQWQLEAKLLNATDRQTEPARDSQGLGRQAWLGVRFDSAGL